MLTSPDTLEAKPLSDGTASPASLSGADLDKLSDAQLADLLHRPEYRESACEALVSRYDSLVRSCAYHYHLPAQYTEELIQVGYVGLLKAINNFDPLLTDRLAAYAQACVSGEIKRFFRDKRWQLRVRRADKELLLRARKVRAELIQQLGSVPTDAEVARLLDVSVEALEAADLAADAFAPASLDAELATPDGLTLGDLLGSDDPDLERTIDMEAVAAHWAELPWREQRILTMRFYGNMTQADIAAELGCSQMHVSRLQARALRYLRRRLLADEAG
jgi:RNA polymerase sigma-70 factor (sigma-B/F/G subfamily)